MQAAKAAWKTGGVVCDHASFELLAVEKLRGTPASLSELILFCERSRPPSREFSASAFSNSHSMRNSAVDGGYFVTRHNVIVWARRSGDDGPERLQLGCCEVSCFTLTPDTITVHIFSCTTQRSKATTQYNTRRHSTHSLTHSLPTTTHHSTRHNKIVV